MKNIRSLKLLTAILITTIFVSLSSTVSALSTPINVGAKISFTFDDGLNSALTQAGPTLAKYGFSATNYVITGCIGMITIPNTCRANTDAVYMNWDQVSALKNNYGWEIGSHTVTHPYLASKDATDGQPKNLTSAQVVAELANSKNTLSTHGINATSFSSPYGDYNQTVLAQIAKYYTSNRGYADVGYNTAPYNDYIIRDQQVQAGVSVATVKGYIDQAVANKQWLVLTFHDIMTNASTNPDDYQYNTADLDQIAAYVKSKNIPVINISEGLANGNNLLANPSFENGLNSGWTTDSSTNFTLNSSNNGSQPSSTNSVMMTSNITKNVHLFSPSVIVNPNSTYILKNFINITKLTTGSVGYYIDEYNANGSWISGQYKLSVSFPWSQTVGFEYKPTSINVTSARLQIILPVNSGVTAYIDNFLWINKDNATVTPPVQANLLTNGTFDNGISNGWTTNGTGNIVADSGNNGSPANPNNSVKMTATTQNTHLFSPKTTVNFGNTYSLSTYINIKQLTSGEVGFYVDEYDMNGNWISGKYITGARSVGSSTISFQYAPTSSNVKTASLQIILVGNSGITAYIDNVIWTKN